MSSRKILGWIMLIAGAGTCIWGIIANNRPVVELALIENDDNMNAPVIAIIFGLIVAVAGILLFLPRKNKN